MQDSEEVSVITDKDMILACVEELAAQSSTLTISTSRTDSQQEFRTSIIKVEADADQLILHQLLPQNWREIIQDEEVINVSCHMKNGSVTFTGTLSPLENYDSDLYCQLSLPTSIKQIQLRSFFRVSLVTFDSTVSLSTHSGIELEGLCRNLSLSGGLFLLNANDKQIKAGDIIEQNHLVIPEILDVSFCAKICHVHQTSDVTTLIGIKFLDLRLPQLNAIRAAMNKLERLNITKQKQATSH